MNTPDLIHADFSQRIVSHETDAVWLPSPALGIHRRMLDRVGAEVARATSVVRYDAGTRFDRHIHGGGEEILVLDGVFSDQSGDYPAGSYLRHPAGSAHAPFSVNGCTILVKLWQFLPEDQQTLRVFTHAFGEQQTSSLKTINLQPCEAWREHGDIVGVRVLSLHCHGGIKTALQRWPAHTPAQVLDHVGGFEAYVLEGVWHDEQHCYPVGTWIRLPVGSQQQAFTQDEGALLYVKMGHLTEQCLQIEMTLLAAVE
jgi:anti-sigma factor ChrR (cupin superfamily)